MRPLIGISTSRRTGWRVYPFIALGVWLAGGRSRRWQAGKRAEVTNVDGVIVGGGDDISPELYGGELVATAVLDPDRDALERCLVEEAMTQGKPVLGICRGAQMLNVALGGNLYQDAYAHYGARKHSTILPKKDVVVEPDTRLAALAGTEPMRVNALHSQAVDRLGAGLRVAARDTSGMVQAVERVEEPFALGVQWHPEYLTYAHRQRALFRALVAAARAQAQHRAQLPEVSATAQQLS
ncbi:gamma-glutamyl-gamma-aminobutyrate hydrolase family protein [Thioclava sp. BHET1]|uniref:Glutamine amidotransferase n=1 Tax=Thioclava dalianensis TaxID=1185766 RepID=A0A074U6V4_9RHOB|nr:gamma-glutamyl-gamma-aminobutyrate hydrolase family protein [Thioclava dalianensis]KEP70402.1 glutamine amidotransferase [Thioclava dalianensis]TMV94018.1 gamma-glutamyl-gamma-aminobutyrate hydrolase family protein [Thioclava sp. BHET1]SFN31706.1 putative glutamine amidotransferase [Thioclava dalianensis]